MPYKSKAQAKKFRVMEAAGEIPKGTSDRWARHTKDIKALPEHVKKKRDAEKKAFVADFLVKAAAAGVTDADQLAAAAERFAAACEGAAVTKAAFFGQDTTGSVAGGLAGTAALVPLAGSVVGPAAVGGAGGMLAARVMNKGDEDDSETLRVRATANAYRRRADEARLHAQIRQLVGSDPKKYVVM